MEPAQFQKAFDHSLKLLAIQKRTVRQLYHKLVEKGFDPQIVDGVLKSLQEKQLLNDEEFARNFVSERLQRVPSGRLKLAGELARKGIGKEIIQRATAVLDADREFEMALKLAQAKAGFFRNLDAQRRRKKIYDFLVRRGFRFEICRNAVHQLK